jgi:hypothetical protein
MEIAFKGQNYSIHTNTSANQIVIVSIITMAAVVFYGMTLGYGAEFASRMFDFITGCVTGFAAHGIEVKKATVPT